MPNRQRKVWDFRANPADVVEFAVDASIAVSIGDLMWLDVDDVKPASHANLWTGSLAGSQGKLAEWFVGVAVSAFTDAVAGTVRVAQRGTFRMTVTTAATFEIGDLVAGSRDGSNNFLRAQQVVKLANTGAVGVTAPAGSPAPVDQNLAIGRVQKRYTSSVTEVEVQIQGRGAAGGGIKAFLTS